MFVLTIIEHIRDVLITVTSGQHNVSGVSTWRHHDRLDAATRITCKLKTCRNAVDQTATILRRHRWARPM
jgi:hypothetical protein